MAIITMLASAANADTCEILDADGHPAFSVTRPISVTRPNHPSCDDEDTNVQVTLTVDGRLVDALIQADSIRIKGADHRLHMRSGVNGNLAALRDEVSQAVSLGRVHSYYPGFLGPVANDGRANGWPSWLVASEDGGQVDLDRLFVCEPRPLARLLCETIRFPAPRVAIHFSIIAPPFPGPDWAGLEDQIVAKLLNMLGLAQHTDQAK